MTHKDLGTCPICNSHSLTFRFKALSLDYCEAEWYPIYLCDECGHGMTYGTPNNQDLYMQGNYDPKEQWWHRVALPFLHLLERNKLRYVSRKRPEKSRIIEIGCGKGRFLHMAKKMGFDVCGIEPSPRSIGHARRTLGNDVYQIDIQNIDSVRALDGKFDIIALWHVLEHIADPTALMDHIKNRLAPSGVVLIAVPNMASYQSQWGKADWYHLDPPRHIHHYSPKSLQMLLAKHGFKIDKKYSNSFYQNYIGEVMTVLNKLLPIKNIILNMLKRNRNVLKKHGAARTATIFIQAAIVVSVLSVPLLLWTIYTQLRGKAGTMVFIVQQ